MIEDKYNVFTRFLKETRMYSKVRIKLIRHPYNMNVGEIPNQIVLNLNNLRGFKDEFYLDYLKYNLECENQEVDELWGEVCDIANDNINKKVFDKDYLIDTDYIYNISYCS